MTTLILRPCTRIPTRWHVSALGTDGVEVPLGRVRFRERWETHQGHRCRTRDEAVHKLAECACLPGPYHLEELGARRRVMQCGQQTLTVTMRRVPC